MSVLIPIQRNKQSAIVTVTGIVHQYHLLCTSLGGLTAIPLDQIVMAYGDNQASSANVAVD